jgi:DNA-binding CsgD family transcriptional regulator
LPTTSAAQVQSQAFAHESNAPLDAIPESDPAYPIVSAIARVVPASCWLFARVTPTGDLAALLASHGNPDDLSRLAHDEFKRQRMKAKTGPRIAATLSPLGDFESGITLLFADAHVDFGILTLLRTTEFGLFTSSEVGMLTFALDSVSDRLSGLRLHQDPQIGTPDALGKDLDPASSETLETASYVLDRDLEIVLAWTSEEQRRIALTGLRTRIAKRLPAVLEEAVRELTAAWDNESMQRPGVARPVPFLVVRTQPLSGPAGLFIGVRIDRFQAPNSLTDAAERFHISPRELQVLALLLDGRHLDEIGQLLHITSSTIQDHIKSMVSKTASRNRTELIAHVLGWEFTPGERPAINSSHST